MTVKVNLLFQTEQPVSGWSEVYYHTGNDITTVRTDTTALVTARLAILAGDCQCSGYRAYRIGQKRYGVTVANTPPTPGTWTAGERSTEPWTALLLDINSSFSVQVLKYLHGIPQSQISEGIFDPTGPFTTALNAFFAVLVAKWKIWAKDPASPSEKSEWPITDVEENRIVSHRIGRPFGLPVGRRVART